MKPFDHLVSPPFYTILYANAAEGLDAGLYSEAISTLVAAATMRSSFLGFTSDSTTYDRPIKVAYWTTHEAMWDWLNTTEDLLPYRIQLDDCLGPNGCLWPWLNRLDIVDVESAVRAA